MKDESKTIYVGQRIGTTLVTRISKLITDSDDYQYNEYVESIDIIPENLQGYDVWISGECSCGIAVNRCLRILIGKSQSYTPCESCSSEIRKYIKEWKTIHCPKKLKSIKLPRINILPKHILAANKIYHPGSKACYKLLELFPTMPDEWAIRKLDHSRPIEVDNIFVINTAWAANKYKERKIIEDNFEPSCKAEYLGKGEYRATCNSCGIVHKIPYSNVYSHHDPVYKNTPTKRRCKCIVKKNQRKLKIKLTFKEQFAIGNPYHKFIGLLPVSHSDGKQRMEIQHITCGKSYEASYTNRKRPDTCPCCAKYFTNFSKPMYLYYIRLNTTPPLYKIGITQRNVKERFSKDPVWLVTELKTWRFQIDQDAFNKEHKLLAQYKEFAYNGVKFLKSEGHTEMFTKDVLGLDK